jgi:hypothetical protein
MFFTFPIRRRRASNLQIVRMDHICERMLPGREPDSLGKLEGAEPLAFAGTET